MALSGVHALGRQDMKPIVLSRCNVPTAQIERKWKSARISLKSLPPFIPSVTSNRIIMMRRTVLAGRWTLLQKGCDDCLLCAQCPHLWHLLMRWQKRTAVVLFCARESSSRLKETWTGTCTAFAILSIRVTSPVISRAQINMLSWAANNIAAIVCLDSKFTDIMTASSTMHRYLSSSTVCHSSKCIKDIGKDISLSEFLNDASE